MCDRSWKLYSEYVDTCLAMRMPSSRIMLFREWLSQTKTLQDERYTNEATPSSYPPGAKRPTPSGNCSKDSRPGKDDSK